MQRGSSPGAKHPQQPSFSPRPPSPCRATPCKSDPFRSRSTIHLNKSCAQVFWWVLRKPHFLSQLQGRGLVSSYTRALSTNTGLDPCSWTTQAPIFDERVEVVETKFPDVFSFLCSFFAQIDSACACVADSLTTPATTEETCSHACVGYWPERARHNTQMCETGIQRTTSGFFHQQS